MKIRSTKPGKPPFSYSRLLICTVFTLGASIVVPLAHAACKPTPSFNEVIVYEHDTFRGKCKVLGIGNYPNSSSFSPVNNDSISSIKVGSGVRAIGFQDANYKKKQATYERGSYTKMGPNAGDSFSSMIVKANQGLITASYSMGNGPNNDGHGTTAEWTRKPQGLANDGTYWYFTETKKLRKYRMSDNVANALPVAGPVGIPSQLEDLGCNHFGDPDFYNGYIFIPVEGGNGTQCGTQPVVAVFDTDLNFLNYDDLYRQSRNAAWIGITKTNGHLHSSGGSVDNNNPIYRYVINTSYIDGSGTFKFILWSPHDPEIYLTDHFGDSVDLRVMQGGVFSPDGQILYLSNGYNNPCVGGDGGSIRAFKIGLSNGELLARGGGNYGPFNYDIHCSAPDYEEPQGLDYTTTSTTLYPGNLHAWLLDQNIVIGSNRVFFKHYTIIWP